MVFDHDETFEKLFLIQQQLQPPPLGLFLENMDKVDSSGFGSSHAMSRRTGA